MDEYTRTLRAAVDAAIEGDRQALYIARWMLARLPAPSAAETSTGLARPICGCTNRHESTASSTSERRNPTPSADA